MITADEVQSAVLAAGITRIDHHECSGCGHMVYYEVMGGALYFCPSCNCGGPWSPPESRSWLDAADWINMQSRPENKRKIAQRFGLSLEAGVQPK